MKELMYGDGRRRGGGERGVMVEVKWKEEMQISSFSFQFIRLFYIFVKI